MCQNLIVSVALCLSCEISLGGFPVLKGAFKGRLILGYWVEVGDVEGDGFKDFLGEDSEAEAGSVGGTDRAVGVVKG